MNPDKLIIHDFYPDKLIIHDFFYNLDVNV